jgi:hypothetical protein
LAAINIDAALQSAICVQLPAPRRIDNGFRLIDRISHD